VTGTAAGHLVTRREPRHRGRGATRVANAVYLALAGIAGRYLGRCEIVESVYVRRSLAAGEVSFGRSDIDLGIRIRDACAAPGQGEALLPLRHAMRRLSRVLPIVGEAEVFSPGELEDWVRLEPLRESFDRSAILVHGAPFVIPPWTIRREDAAARFCFWFDRYLPVALQQGHRRNLRKFALEMWAALAVAQGHFDEPPLSRQEMAAAWRRVAPDSGPPARGAPAQQLAATIFTLADEAHALLLPPLPTIERPITLTVRLPPILGVRTIHVGPVAALLAAPGAAGSPAIRLTPEALDLYLHYANPFLFDQLSGDLQEHGFRRPALERYLVALEKWTHGHIARRPAFGSASYGQGPRAIAFSRWAAGELAAGRSPAPIDDRDLGELGHQDARRDDYFRDWYSAAYRACAETRAVVAGMRGQVSLPAGQTANLSPATT
jgi:hypothetical protein